MKTTLRRTRAGFTLLELMASMAILSIGLFAVVQLQLVAMRSASYAWEVSEAQSLASTMIGTVSTHALGYVQSQITAFPTPSFSDAFRLETLATAPSAATVSAPAGEWNFPTDLKSPTNLFSFPGAVVGNLATGGSTNCNANLVNVFGNDLAAAGGNFSGMGSAYRINYVAHPVFVDNGSLGPSQELQRITVFVTWDNKDYSPQTLPVWATACGDCCNYYKRNMVAYTYYVARLTL